MKVTSRRGTIWTAVLLNLPIWLAHGAEVTISGRQILVGNTAFSARGVSYAPTPIGQAGDQWPYGDYFTANHAPIYSRDLARMRQMGVNCLRIYGWNPTADHTGFLDAAYNQGRRPIWVLLNRWVNPDTDWGNPSAVNSIASEWVTLATNVMRHPAILGYLIGNELNWADVNRTNPVFWAALNQIAGAIRQHDTNHLVSTALADLDVAATIGAFDAAMANFNVWCVQAYRGNSFGTLFRDYASASGKPLLVTEFGMDAYDTRTGAEYADDAAVQAEYVVALWKQLRAQSAIASGGFVFEWSDEWWKWGTPSLHNSGGWAGAFPDGWADEEWWGIHRVSPGGGGAPDVLEPRRLFEQLRALWTAQLSIAPLSLGQVRVSVEGAAGQTAVLQRAAALPAQDWVAVATNTIPFAETLSTGTNRETYFRVELP
jgi:hypothetical protein